MINKRILTLITLLLFLLLLVGCKAINQAPIITSIPITAVELGEAYTYDVNATDPEGDTLAYSLITKPTGMTIKSTTGLIKWTPKAEGNFAVAVKVSDGVLYIIQSFTIVASKLPDPPAPPPVVNYAPIITSIPGDTVIIGVTYLYDVNATDPNGDVLTYSLTKKPDDMTINSTTGLIGWTPASDQIGNNPVIVKVSDGKKATTQSFTITVKAVEPDPEIELTGIVVDPKKMTLFVGESKAIKSVTAIYEIKGFGVPIPLGYCTYDLVDETVITVSNVGVVKTVGEGTTDIVVSYKGKFDTVEVTVKVPIVIDGILSPGEWDDYFWFTDNEGNEYFGGVPEFTYYETNDSDYLYFATIVDDPTPLAEAEKGQDDNWLAFRLDPGDDYKVFRKGFKTDPAEFGQLSETGAYGAYGSLPKGVEFGCSIDDSHVYYEWKIPLTLLGIESNGTIKYLIHVREWSVKALNYHPEVTSWAPYGDIEQFGDLTLD